MKKRSRTEEKKIMIEERNFHDISAKFYDNELALNRRYEISYNNRRISEVLDHHQSNDRILEVGCGTGHTTKQLTFLKKSYSKLYCIDISPEMIKRNKTFTPKSHIIFYIISSGTDLPFKDKSFDLILCFATLHHIPNYMRVLRESKRILKSNGRLFLDEPLDNALFKLFQKIGKFFGYKPLVSPFEEISKGFQRIELVNDIEKFFKIERLSYRRFLGTLFIWLHNDKFEKLIFWLDSLIELIPLIKLWSPYITIISLNKINRQSH